MSGFEIQVTSPYDRERLVVEVNYEQECVAELLQEHEDDPISIEIYSRQDGKPWQFRADEFSEVVGRAIKRMVDLDKPKEV